jgi:mono/diheme cytochrome c family protein
MSHILPWAAVIAALFVASAAADDAGELFKKSVRPLFERKCFECHSSKADELKGNLKLETLDDILKGGATGPAVIAGDVENSFLLRAIRYQEDDFQMPPSGRLPDDDIKLVEKWVKALQAEDKQRRRGQDRTGRGE